jgi:hypothetical protein
MSLGATVFEVTIEVPSADRLMTSKHFRQRPDESLLGSNQERFLGSWLGVESELSPE